MATDWIIGKSGSFDVGTDLGTTSAWAVMRFEWEEQYSESAGTHRLTITPKAKTSVINLANAGETSSHYIIGTVKIAGETVFSQSTANVATFFYSTNSFYNFTDATDGYNTEIWTSGEFTTSSPSVSISLTLVPASSYWSNQTISSTKTLTMTTITTTTFSGAVPYIYNGSTWVQATPYIYNGGWRVATGYAKK